MLQKNKNSAAAANCERSETLVGLWNASLYIYIGIAASRPRDLDFLALFAWRLLYGLSCSGSLLQVRLLNRGAKCRESTLLLLCIIACERGVCNRSRSTDRFDDKSEK